MKITVFKDRGMVRCFGRNAEQQRVMMNFRYQRQEDGDAELEYRGVKYENPDLSDSFVSQAFSAATDGATLVEWELAQ